MARRNWIVSISSENDDPMIFGPYVKHRAEALAERFNEVCGKLSDEDQQGNWMNAGAYPIQNPGIREMLAEFGLR
jgi:hypothetical protein